MVRLGNSSVQIRPRNQLFESSQQVGQLALLLWWHAQPGGELGMLVGLSSVQQPTV